MAGEKEGSRKMGETVGGGSKEKMVQERKMRCLRQVLVDPPPVIYNYIPYPSARFFLKKETV